MTSPLLPRDPTNLGDYTLTGRLGSGGFGVIYEAVAPSGGQVAIKLLNSELSTDPTFRARLAQEGTAMAAVRSDRTAQVIDVVTDGPDAYLVMELVDGTTLDQHTATNGPFKGPELWFVAEGLVEGLAAIHRAGIVHRDLKPANIMYGADGIKILDFGISAIVEDNPQTRTGAFMASAAWISPEQVKGDRATPASDIFMLGLVLAFAATGQHPYGTGRSDAVMFRIAHQQPNLDNVPYPLNEAVKACLEPEPSARPTGDALTAFFSSGGNQDLSNPDVSGPYGTLIVGAAPIPAVGDGKDDIDAVVPDEPDIDDNTDNTDSNETTEDSQEETGEEPVDESHNNTDHQPDGPPTTNDVEHVDNELATPLETASTNNDDPEVDDAPPAEPSPESDSNGPVTPSGSPPSNDEPGNTVIVGNNPTPPPVTTTRSSTRVPVAAAIAIVAVLAIGGVMFAALGGDKPETTSPATTQPSDSNSTNDNNTSATNNDTSATDNDNDNDNDTIKESDSNSSETAEGSNSGSGNSNNGNTINDTGDDGNNNSNAAAITDEPEQTTNEPEQATETDNPTTNPPTNTTNPPTNTTSPPTATTSPPTATTQPTNTTTSSLTTTTTTTGGTSDTTTSNPVIPEDTSGPGHSEDSVSSSSSVSAGGTLTFSANYGDGSGVAMVVLYAPTMLDSNPLIFAQCQNGSDSSWTYETNGYESPPGATPVSLSCVIDENQAAGTYRYDVYAYDSLNNYSSLQRTVTITREEPTQSMFSELSLPTQIAGGETIQVSGTVIDPDGIALITSSFDAPCQEGSAYQVVPEGEPTSFTFSLSCILSPYAPSRTLNASLQVDSVAGNSESRNWTITLTNEIGDSNPPVTSELSLPQSVDAGQAIRVSGSAADEPAGLSMIKMSFNGAVNCGDGSNLHASFDGNPPTLDFELVCFVEADQQAGTYSAEFYVEDSVGNWDRTFWEITVVPAG